MAKARKVAIEVEVRALSGSLLGSMELSASARVAEVKERLNLGKNFDLTCGAELLLDDMELRELVAPVELCLVWRRRGFAYIGDLHGCLSLWDLETGTVAQRGALDLVSGLLRGLRCSMCQPRCPVCVLADWASQQVLCCLEVPSWQLKGDRVRMERCSCGANKAMMCRTSCGLCR